MRYKRNKRKHEDNLKAELAKWAQRSGLFLHLEYTHENCRFDAVLIREDEVLAIIEVKSWTRSRARTTMYNPTDQLKKYIRFGLPVYVLWSLNGTKKLIKIMKELTERHDKGQRPKKGKIRFFPVPQRPKKTEALMQLIAEQKRDMKHSSRVWAQTAL